MTDRERELAKLQPKHITDTNDDDFVDEDLARPAGSEVDPDSVRPAPGVDHDGNPLEDADLHDDEIRKGH